MAHISNHHEDSLLELMWLGEDDGDEAQRKAQDSLAAAVAKVSGLRPFPVVAGELLRLLQTREFRMAQVQQLMERDPALATRVIAVCNSPMFCTQRPCDSLDEALVRLGTRTVEEIVAAVAAAGMFGDVPPIGKRVLAHCAGVAAIVRVLATMWRHGAVPQVFLCGLLHDVGKLLSLQCEEFDYASLDESEVVGADQVYLVERAQLGYDHALLGAHALRLWHIAEPVPEVVAYHHQPGRAYERGTEIGLLVALVRIADAIEGQMWVDEELDEAFLERLMRDGAPGFADISAGDIRGTWEGMLLARRYAIALFAG